MGQALDSDLLRQIPLFSQLDQVSLQRIAGHSELIGYVDEDILFRKGDSANCVFIVVSGEVEIIIDTETGPHNVAALGPNQLFGEMALLNNISRNATLRAHGQLNVLSVNAETFFDVLQQDSDMSLKVMQQLADKLAKAHDHAADLKRQILQLQKSQLSFRRPSSMELTSDRARFNRLWQRNLRADAKDRSDHYYDLLIDAYNEAPRVYHTLLHIEDCLSLFDRVKTRLENPDALELGIWYHDAIYQIGGKDNEERSAEMFMQHSDGVFTDSFRQRVHNHIMATKHAGEKPEQKDSRYMVDIDLSSFGKPWDKFISDSEKVRSEMPHLPDHLFYPNQFAFQNALLDRSQFFQSEYFFERYEETARYNLAEYFKLVQQFTNKQQRQ